MGEKIDIYCKNDSVRRELTLVDQNAIYINLSIPLTSKPNYWNPEKGWIENYFRSGKETINQTNWLSFSTHQRLFRTGSTWGQLKHKKIVSSHVDPFSTLLNQTNENKDIPNIPFAGDTRTMIVTIVRK